MRLGKKLMAGVMTLAMVLSLVTPGIGRVTANAAEAPVGEFTEKSIKLSTTSGILENGTKAHYDEDGYKGYIQSLEDSKIFTSDYIKISYTVSGTVTDSTKVFSLKPYDTSWGGWADNPVTIGDSIKSGSSYVAYLSTAAIVGSLNTGKTIRGINLEFAAESVSATLTGLSYLTENSAASEDDEDSHQLASAKNIFKVTGTDLAAAGLDAEKLVTGQAKVTFYVNITKADKYSWLKARSGGTKGGSNKYLIGSACTKQTSSLYWIQNSGKDDGKGSAGTGNYKFPDSNISKSKVADAADLSLTVDVYTTNTEAKVIGIIFSDGQSVSVSYDSAGKMTLTKGFKAPKCESTTLEDNTVIKDVWQQTVEMRKANLKLSLDYIANKMDETKYTADSWKALQDAVVTATKEYNNAQATTASLKSARDKLENAKAKLIFNTTTDDSKALPFRELSAAETIAEMGAGINLGNTMDGHSGFTPSETSWQKAVTTKEYIKALHDAGFNTVRIPVTWGNMIDDAKGYAINDTWLSRVQEIVDYCVEQDMYAIINIHHDGAEQSGWLKVAADDIDAVMEKYEAVWRQIAERFKDYDEHLIFESMNEITCSETDKNGSKAVEYDTPVIVNFNQLFVNTVRSTGSNNTKRWLAAVAHYANNGSNSAFTLPEDTYNDNNRIMFAAHIYVASTNTTWGYDELKGLWERLSAMKKKFGSDVPMYLGEYGNRNYKQSGTDTGYNDVARAWFCEIANRACKVAGVVPVVWDQGYGEDPNETGLFSFWNRKECKPLFKTIIDGMMRGTFLEASADNNKWNFKDIVSDPEIVEITSITPSKTSVTMNVSDVEKLTVTTAPSETNDVVLWSTDDDSVATVFNGMIRAKGIGSTTIHVYSQNGSVVKDIKVNVVAKKTDKKAEITVDNKSETIVVNKNASISASVTGGEKLTYVSSNPAVATVNSLGKVFAKSIGTTYIIITSESGATKTVKICVKDALDVDEISLGLKVLYNDSTHKYWSAETGSVIKVTGNGQYTMTFDCDTDLSAAAKKAGITNLDKLTAIYIKDQNVDTGEATASPVESCKFTIDKVVLDGVELTLNNLAAAKEVVKGGVFDTGTPVNAWDGSAVDEVSASNHVATFTTNTAHKKIEVTFTLSDMNFKVVDSSVENPATEIKADKTTIYVCPDTDSETVEISVKVTPANTGNLVTFVSSDESAISVPRTAVSVDENGYAKVTATITGTSDATITVMTDNGLEMTIEIVREHDYEEVGRADGYIKYECKDCDKEKKEPVGATDPDEPGSGDGNESGDVGASDTGLFALEILMLMMAAAVIVVIRKKNCPVK